MLRVVPVQLRAAREYVRQLHRHHAPPQGGLYAVAVADEDNIRGVAIVGRTVARGLTDGWTVEVTRVATDGTRNACSMLYGAAWRAARALGYRRLITYTLPQEGGASLRAAGWTRASEVSGGEWSRKSRPRSPASNRYPTCDKWRWEVVSDETSDPPPRVKTPADQAQATLFD